MKKLFTLLLTVLMLANSLAFAVDKQDVKDPVLKEVINKFDTKMPRFINKYGENVFVADENMTRASFLQALYEYDSKNKPGSAASAVSRQEFDALKARLASVEKGGTLKAGTALATTGGAVDTVALITELEPNMPMLLDNTLAQSKVFQELKTQVSNGAGVTTNGVTYAYVDNNFAEIDRRLTAIDKKMSGTDFADGGAAGVTTNGVTYTYVDNNFADMDKRIQDLSTKIDSLTLSTPVSATGGKTAQAAKPSSKEVAELKASLADIQRSYVALSKRIDEVESAPTVVASSGGDVDKSQMKDLNAKIADVRKTTLADMDKLEKRIDKISTARVSSGGGESSGGKSSTSTIAKISLGITMVAALFIAR
jgi:hypothetical protein